MSDVAGAPTRAQRMREQLQPTGVPPTTGAAGSTAASSCWRASRSRSAGLALLVLPGPAFVVIPIGLAMLALEFAWAERLLDKALEQADVAERKASETTPAQRALAITGTVVAAAAADRRGLALGHPGPARLTPRDDVRSDAARSPASGRAASCRRPPRRRPRRRAPHGALR